MGNRNETFLVNGYEIKIQVMIEGKDEFLRIIADETVFIIPSASNSLELRVGRKSLYFER